MLMHVMRWCTVCLACILGVTSGYYFESPQSTADCLDVAIVGGGAGGTYTGYRLRNKGQRISIFEYSDRIGGRTFSAELPTVPGTTVDFGAMRFIPNAHTSLVNIINEVGLPIEDFPQNNGNPNETVYYLRGRYLRTEELGGPRTPYNLRPEERLSPDRLIWKLFTENTNMSRIRYPPEDEIYTIHTRNGFPLYTLTLNNFYSRYASREAYNYIRDASVWDWAAGEFGAHLALISLTYPSDRNTYEDLKTIGGGFNRLPKRLLSRFLLASNRHRLHLNHQLVAMEGRPRRYKLRFAVKDLTGYDKRRVVKQKIVCAKKVVLAMQRDSIERINFRPFRNPIFRDRLNSVIDVQAQKIFLAYRYPWWKSGNADITHARADLDSKFTYDWRFGSNGYVIHLPSYSEGSSNVALWRELQGQGRSISGSMPGHQRVSTEVRDRIHSYMSRVYRIPESDIPPTVGGGMQLWDRFPYKAGWHFYKPSYRMEETRDFILRPYISHDVFIVGNSWWSNDLQGWVESSLRMVELLMKRYLW